MMEYILSLILGLFVGSFINCVVYRVYNKESFLKGRSKCPKCGHKLKVLDLIPVLSFLFLGGKCRYCKEKISIQYPLVEIGTGLLFFSVAYLLQANFLETGFFNLAFLNLLFYFFITTCFVMIFVFDFKWFIIPDGLTFTGIIVTLTYLLSQTFVFDVLSQDILLQRVITAFVVFLFFFALYFFSGGRAMGFGNVKLVILLGLLLGFPKILPALFIAFAIGAIIGIILMLFKKKGIKSEVPFGPFLVLGTFIAMFFGDHIIQWYLSLM